MWFGIVLRRASGLYRSIRNEWNGILVRAQIPAVGDGSKFFGRVTILEGKNIRIGRNVQSGDRVCLFANKGAIAVGDGCSLLNDVEIESLGKIQIGRESTLNNSVVVKGAGIQLGERVWVARNCVIEGTDIRVADRAILGPFVHVNDGNHRIDPQTHEILMEQGEYKPIYIAENAWIGSGAMILGGVSIGRGAIIGARSVVTKDIPAFCIAVGNPARVIKNRVSGERFDVGR